MHASPNLHFACASLLLFFFLASCGGGSTVTAVSLEADSNDVAVGGRTEVTARATGSITDNTMGERVTFTIRHNESGSRLDVINDRLDGNGEAKAIFYAGPREGTDIIEASFGSGARTTTTIRVGEGIVIGDIRLEAFSQSGGGVSQAWRIRATVTDTRGFPAPGVTVLFSTNNGNLELTEETTNNVGIAETILTLADATQDARIWATAGGISVSINVGPRN
ncbi:Ig-like domain-containing protein [Desulfonatronum thioautotrophicum]|uniref:Ig-like domain-containing protein n=1 Tax=Desulfonatronum thioautotrophicum TaxID=617001 RepID=UPI0005EB401D|nr:Ig-like domain-containing protein [Desulfonatronum thioautotrophicum]